MNWLQYELKFIGAVTQAKPMGSNTNRILVTNTFNRDTVTKSQRNIVNIVDEQPTAIHVHSQCVNERVRI